MSNIPYRVQRKRSKGWKMPPNTVYAGRPGIFGNPYNIKDYLYEAAEEVSKFVKEKTLTPAESDRAWIPYATALSLQAYKKHLESNDVIRKLARGLKGKNLACWCRIMEFEEYQDCHCDILLAFANNISIQTVKENNKYHYFKNK